MINLIRRTALRFAIFSLEAQIKGSTDTLAWLNEVNGDVMLRTRIEIARTNTRRDLARYRAAYNETLPVGRRRIWSMA